MRTFGAGRLALAQQQGQRMFDLRRDQQLSDMVGERELQRLHTEADIRETERLKLKNEAAQSLFSTVQQRHPEWKMDPDKSLAENVASAHAMNDEDTMQGVKALGGMQSKAKSEKDAILSKYGAFAPADPVLVNRQLALDPTLTTGHFPVLGPKEIALLNSGKSPEEIAKTFNLTSNQTALLNAAQAARATIKTRQEEIAAQKAQVDLQAIDSKYSPYNQLSADMLSSVSKNQPWLLGRAAEVLGSPSSPAAPNAHLDGNGLIGSISGGAPAGSPPAPTPQSAASPNPAPQVDTVPGTPPQYDPNTFAPSIRGDATQQQIDDENQNLTKKQQDLQRIEGILNKGSTTLTSVPWNQSSVPPASFPTVPLTDKDRYDYAVLHNQLQKEVLTSKKKLLSLADQKRAALLPSAAPLMSGNDQGGSSVPPAPPAPFPIPPLPNAPVSSGPGQAPDPSSMNAQPSSLQPLSAPQANGPSSAFQTMNGMNLVGKVLGTSNPADLQAAAQYATTQLGMSQNDLQALLHSALLGDPNAVAKAKQIMAQSKGSSGIPQNGFVPPGQPSMSSPPAGF